MDGPRLTSVAETIEDRVTLPIEGSSGSEARGHYRVTAQLGAARRHESIVKSLGVEAGASTIVLHDDSLGDVRDPSYAR